MGPVSWRFSGGTSGCRPASRLCSSRLGQVIEGVDEDAPSPARRDLLSFLMVWEAIGVVATCRSTGSLRKEVELRCGVFVQRSNLVNIGHEARKHALVCLQAVRPCVAFMGKAQFCTVKFCVVQKSVMAHAYRM